MNPYLFFILSMIIMQYAVHLTADIRNARHVSTELPAEFAGWYDAAHYRRSQEYLRDQTYGGIRRNTFFTCVSVGVIVFGGFNRIDLMVRQWSDAPLIQGLFFIGIIFLGARLLALPFAAHHTFGIEARYGFNRTTVGTFVGDFVKSVLVAAILGGVAFAAILWLFIRVGPGGWLWCWAAVTAFQLFLLFLAPVLIMPLFNTYTPLPEGPLKQEIESYARSQRFALGGIFTIDGSRRSRKSNAFFTGLGRFRRIALFDTLIKNHTGRELVAILAHEIGHYKKRHILKGTVFSVLCSGGMLYVLSRFLANPQLFAAFRMEQLSVHASLVFFGFLYTPVQMLLGIIEYAMSRRHEFAADRFSVRTYPHPEAFITALKKLSVHNLANLTPHPMKVLLSYSHPPVLRRIAAIRALQG